jgi:hypothetical protein
VEVERLCVALASSPGVAPAQQLSIGAFLLEEQDGTGEDLGIALVELWAHLADVLSFVQDQIADEAYLETERRGVRIRLHAGLQPALFLVADDRRAYVVSIGSETGDATVRFGEGAAGKQPPSGLENVTATYRRGAGDTGNLELTGLDLQPPFVVIVAGNTRTRARARCWRVAD